MTRREYYAERRELIGSKLEALYFNRRASREQMHACYRLRYTRNPTPKTLAEYGRLVDVPVWFKPTLQEQDR